MTPAPEEERGHVLVAELDWRNVVVVMAGLTLIATTAAIVIAAPTATVLLAVALFFGMALDPVIVRWQRVTHWPRGPAAATVLLLSVIVLGAFFIVAGGQIAHQASRLSLDLPRVLRSLDDVPIVGDAFARHHVATQLQHALGHLPSRFASTNSDLSKLLDSLGLGAASLLIGLVLLTGVALDGPMLVGAVRRALPVARRDIADEIGRVAYAVLARYFAGSLLLAVLHAIWVTATGFMAGVPLSPVLGVWVGITSLIPQVGGFLGFVVVVAVSLSQGIGVALFMAVTFFVYMVFNNNVLLPLVVGHVVDVAPPITMLAAIAGFAVAGVVGSLMAVPTVGVVKAVLTHLRHRGEPGYEPLGGT